jgi:hypothetical protein
MTIEEKDLLLKDLSARLPYGVIVNVKGFDYDYNDKLTQIYNGVGCSIQVTNNMPYDIEQVKPILFPISSMNKEQKREYNCWKHEVPVCYYEYGDIVEEVELVDSPESFEYLIENHFDYRGLIEKGLAIDATNKNIY